MAIISRNQQGRKKSGRIIQKRQSQKKFNEKVPSFLTDGSNTIFEGHFENSELKISRQHRFYQMNQRGIRTPIYRLNEIEFAQGKILANVWQSDDIYVLNMEQDTVDRYLKRIN